MEQHDLQIVHLCCRQTDLASSVPWKTLSFSHQDPYKVPKGTLSSATAGLLLIIIAKITIIVIVIAAERDTANVCNICLSQEEFTVSELKIGLKVENGRYSNSAQTV